MRDGWQAYITRKEAGEIKHDVTAREHAEVPLNALGWKLSEGEYDGDGDGIHTLTIPDQLADLINQMGGFRIELGPPNGDSYIIEFEMP